MSKPDERPYPTATSPLGRLFRRLELEALGELRYQGGSGRGGVTENNRLFGGLVLGQAAMAAARSVERPDFRLHSLQTQFLRPTAPEHPVFYEVEATKDGRSFANRIVRVLQNDKVMFCALASFGAFNASPARHARPMPAVPDPEGLPNRDEVRGRPKWQDAPIDIRLCAPLPDPQKRHGTTARYWFRPSARLPADHPALHEALLAYASDRTLLGTAFQPYLPDEPRGVTLDHALQVFHPVDLNQWLLFDTESPAAGYGRGLAHGYFYERSGSLVAAVVQQGTLILP